jgi:hypothetical protein
MPQLNINLYNNDLIRSSLMRSADRQRLEDDLEVPVPISTDEIKTGFAAYLPCYDKCLFPVNVRAAAEIYSNNNFRGYIDVNVWGLKFLKRLSRKGEDELAMAFIDIFSDVPYFWKGWLMSGAIRLNRINLKVKEEKH